MGHVDAAATSDSRPRAFGTTHWSLVVAAAGGDVASARAALARLCETYWYPLYAFVRRKGHAPHEAEDLTQAFFAQLLEHNWLARADQSKGRFRSFLLTALNRFLANEWDRATSQRRGGHLRRVPFDVGNAESRFSLEPADTDTPEQEFERQWALAVLEHVLARLREEYVERGQAAMFDALKPSLVGSREAQPYARLASEMGTTEANVKVAVYRLRQRCRERLLEEISHTVASHDEVEAEVRHLFSVLAGR
jgi:RNA polymerase sigma-70 factor (ECF subfamily)